MFSEEVVNLLLKITLFLITLGLGFSIGKNGILDLMKASKPVWVGLISQMLLLPILAFAICLFLPIPNMFKLGILIISFCPGGSTTNLLSFLFKANVSLSVTLSIANGFLCLLSIPLFMNLSAAYFSTQAFEFVVPYNEIVINLLLLLLLPAVLGIILNGFFAKIVNKATAILKIVLPALLAIVFGVKIFASSDSGGILLSSEDLLQILPPLLALNLSSILLGYFGSSAIKLSQKNALTIGIETGLQNTALALLIAVSLNDVAFQKPAVVYAAFSFFSTALIVWGIKKGLKHKA